MSDKGVCRTALATPSLKKYLGPIWNRREQFIALFQKTKQNILVKFGTPPRFKPLCGANLEQNAGTIHESNQEYLSVFKDPCGDDPQVPARTPPCF